MHVPKPFQITDIEDVHEQIENIKLAQLVNLTEEGLLATPLPMYLVKDEGENGTLYGHIARANKQNKLAPKSEALVIFQGPNQYVTPSWYPSKHEDHKVVPTWDYLAIHAHGPLEIIDNPKELLKIVDKLTAKHEPQFSNWTTDEAPKDYLQAQLKGIVGVRIPIERIEASAKLHQNKPKDRAGVINGVDGIGNEEVGQLLRDF